MIKSSLCKVITLNIFFLFQVTTSLLFFPDFNRKKNYKKKVLIAYNLRLQRN